MLKAKLLGLLGIVMENSSYAITYLKEISTFPGPGFHEIITVLQWLSIGLCTGVDGQ